jgi:tRNA1(Val) A37 N6-methylase TrmN6
MRQATTDLPRKRSHREEVDDEENHHREILQTELSNCWKCQGKGRKFQKKTRQWDGMKCGVCQGTGQRQASTKSQTLAQQEGTIIPLRGYPKNYRHSHVQQQSIRQGGFAGIPAVENNQDHPRTGELLASLGCGNWRLFQLANGHKLTVDDFICAWVAAKEVQSRGEYARDYKYFGCETATYNNKSFRHVDLGCGCGSVLMTLAWAFPNMQSVGVEAQRVSYDLCRRGLLWNLGHDGTSQEEEEEEHNHQHSRVRLVHSDLRTWNSSHSQKFHLVTGTPPYFPTDRFVASANHAQKVRCRVPTRGAASDYIQAAERLLEEGGILVLVETARQEGAAAILATVQELESSMQVVKRIDIVTRAGLPPRFSCWVILKRTVNLSKKDGRVVKVATDERANPVDECFPISTFTLRDLEQRRTLEYTEAMDEMGWIDFENTRYKLVSSSDND